jgi:hypothetical protein
MTNQDASNMNLNLQHLNLRSRDDLDRWVEEQILALGEARQIDEANVGEFFMIRRALAPPSPAPPRVPRVIGVPPVIADWRPSRGNAT